MFLYNYNFWNDLLLHVCFLIIFRLRAGPTSPSIYVI